MLAAKIKYDINSAVAAYASSFGNNKNRLEEWCLNNCCAKYKNEIVSIVHGIENSVTSKIFNGNKSLTGYEILEMIEKTCGELNIGIQKEGINALLDNVAWMAWHEGYLKDGYNKSDYEKGS